MQIDILLKQVLSSLEDLKTHIAKFEKHASPSTQYAEQLYHSLQTSNKFVSAFLVLKEQKDISPDLDLHLKLIDKSVSEKPEIKLEIKPEPVVIFEKVEVITTLNEKENTTEPPQKNEEIVSPTAPISTNISVEKIIEPPASIIEKKYPPIVININDKFRFINELFGSNASEYNIVIEQINSLNSLEDCLIYLGELKKMYNWNDEQEMVKKIDTLSRKRFY